MKKIYIKPRIFIEKTTIGIIPVAAVATALGVSQAVAGLGMGAAAGLAAGSAVAKKLGSDNSYFKYLPSLEAIVVRP